MSPYLLKIGTRYQRMFVCVVYAINGAELLVWNPMTQPVARAELMPQGFVDEMFVGVWYG